MGDYSANYERVSTADGWIGKNSFFVQEFFGTIFWVFLAGMAQVFNLGLGFQFGLSWVIATSLFQGDFNAMTTMLRACLGGDWLDCIFRLLTQIAAGLVGFWLFTALGYNFTSSDFNNTANSLVADGAFSTDGLWSWFRLLLTLMVYFAAASRLSTGMKWIDAILLLGVTFAIGGDGFAFAPNRWWFVSFKGFVGALAGAGWDYLAYLICGFLAKYLLDLYDGDATFDWGLPKE